MDAQLRMRLPAYLQQAREIAAQAGRLILGFYGDPACAVQDKSDGSPLTAADEAADVCIREALTALTPDIPVVTEECVGSLDETQRAGVFWLVDPLDGTREFLSRNGEFTVNIALIERGVPILGVVGAPALGQAYWGALGLGAFMQDGQGTRAIACRKAPATPAVLTSRSHGDNAALDAFLQGRACTRVPMGSSLKFCLLAAGQADLYPRLGRTMEWDTGAGHAVLRAAGGDVTQLDGAPFVYGKAGYANGHFVARGL